MEKNFFIGQNQLVKASEVAAIQKAGNKNTYYLKQAGKKDSFTLTNKSEIRKEFEEVKNQQGLIGKAWDGFKNLFGMKSGSKHVEEIIKKAEKGEITQEEAKEAIAKYKEGQKTSVDVVADVASGILSVLAFTLAVPTGGASLAIGLGLATAVGAGIKIGVKAGDAFATGKEYNGKDLLYDTVTGGINGLLGPVTNGIGNTVTATIGKQITKTVIKEGAEEVAEQAVKQGIKQTAKNVILNQTVNLTGGTAAQRALAVGAGMAVDGALGGAADNMTRAALNGENVLQAGVEGAIGGMIMAPIIGGGFNLAGKAGHAINNKITTKIVLPDGIKTKFKQGNIGDCALLSTIDGMMSNPKTAKAFKKSITKTIGGDYNVKIGDQVVRVAKDSLSDEMLSDKTGIRIFEQAYKQIAGDIDGGFAEVVAKQFGLKPIHIPQDSITDELLDNLARNQGDTVLSFGTIVDTDGAIAAEGQRHYFTIKNIDAESKTVTLTSPVDTSKTIELSYDEVKTAGISIDGGSVKELDLQTVARSADDVKFRGKQELTFDEQIIKEIDLSALNADGIGCYLDFTTKDFMKNLVTYLKGVPEEKQKELLLKIGIQFPTSQKKVTTYNGVLDISKLGISEERLAEISKLDIKDVLFKRRKEFSPEEAIAYLVNKYTTQNSFHTGNTELDSALNKILEEMPEFINIVSKPQHSHQKYSVDIHTLKVLQNILNDSHYKTLTPKQKEILKYATLLHDFGKNALEVTPGHSIDSEKYARTILSQNGLDEDTTEQILTLIKNHHWFEEYNNGLLDREGVKALFGNNEELFDLAIILSKSDIMAVTNLSDMQTRNWYYELISFVENKPMYQIEPPISIQRSNHSLSEIPDEIKSNGYISTFSELGLDATKAHQRQELLASWIEKIKAGKIQELSDNQILDIWATKKYRELDDFPSIQEEYITRFNSICRNQTITFHEDEIFIRTIPVESNACDSSFSIGKDTTWPAAAARIKLSQDGSLPEGVERRLVKDKLEYLSRNPEIERSGKIPPSTIYIIEPNTDSPRAISGFDWEQTGSLTGEDKNLFGSGIFRQEINENGYSTEVNFSAEERFKLHPHKPPTTSKIKTISGLEFDINIVYVIPD